MLDKVRIAAVILFIILFTVSVFTRFPEDPGTRTTLGILVVGAAGVLFGPTIMKRKDNGQ